MRALQRFVGELRRRNVLRVCTAFLIGGWVTLQIVDILGPALGLPDWALIAVAAVIVAGLPLALAVAWFFEITPAGMVPTSEVPVDESITRETGRRIDRVIIALLAIALAFFIGEYIYRSVVGEQRHQRESLPTALAILSPVIDSNAAGAGPLVRQIAAEIGRALTSLSSLPVTPQEVVEAIGSGLSPTAAGETLGVRYLLLFEPIDALDDKVHVQLFDAAREESLWSATFDPEIDDALDFQQLVSQQVALQMGVLSAAEANRLFSLPTENSEAYGLYLRGMQALSMSGYEARQEESDAEQLFSRALDLDPQFSLAHAALCRIDVSRFAYTESVAAFERAERHCHRALTLGRLLGETHIALGELYKASGQHQRAEEAFLEALSINPSYISALIGLANTYDHLGDVTRAEETYKRAIRAQPSYYRTYDALADHYYVNGDYDQCRANLLLAAELAPNDPVVWSDIGTTYVLTGAFGEAEDAFKKALTLNPSEEFAISNLATTYYFQKKYSDARSLYERAVEESPESTTAWRNLGDVLLALGSGDEARSAFQKTVELAEGVIAVNPTDSQTLSNLIVAYATLGDVDRFFRTMQRQETSEMRYPGDEYDMAVGYCRLERWPECESHVQKALDDGFPAALINADPDLEPVLNLESM